MNVKNYLKLCIDKNDTEEFHIVWNLLGAKECNNNTIFYAKDSLYCVSEETSLFYHYIFYCDNAYNGKIDWTNISTLDEANHTVIADGITCNCFTFYPEIQVDPNVAAKLVEAVTALDGYTPFTKYSQTASGADTILIEEDTYMQIMQVLGMPFIKQSELEYNKEAILKLAIEPALREYYTCFPIVQEEVRPSRSGDFMLKLPTEPYPAYNANVYVTDQSSFMSGNLNGISPLATMGTNFAMSATMSSLANSKFGGGLPYSKSVPGFTGLATTDGGSKLSQFMDAWVLSSTMKNIMRREKVTRIHVPGDGFYMKGYSTISGFMNIRWFCWSRDFNDVPFEDYTQVLDLCQAHVKFSIGSIRELLRTDSNLPFRDGIRKEGQEEIKAIIDKWAESPSRLRFATSRGGYL